MTRRRLVIRRRELACPECGTRVTVSVPPRAYVEHVHGREETEVAMPAACVCGHKWEVTVGELRRAAA